MRTEPNARIWSAAEQFFKAGELLWESGEIDKYCYPLIVNYSFSCELSLKASEGRRKASGIIADGFISPASFESSIRGHKLYEIFSQLQPSTKKSIEFEFSQSTGENLDVLLKKCSTYFESSRYSFEQVFASYSISDVRTLAQGLLHSVLAYGATHNRFIQIDSERSQRSF